MPTAEALANGRHGKQATAYRDGLEASEQTKAHGGMALGFRNNVIDFRNNADTRASLRTRTRLGFSNAIAYCRLWNSADSGRGVLVVRDACTAADHSAGCARKPEMTKKVRNIGTEILGGFRELKRGRVGRVVNIPDIANTREKTGLTQERFAELLGVSVRTLQDWEQGRRAPSGAARTLLMIAAKNPRALLDVA